MIQDNIKTVSLPHRVDWIISEWMGTLLLVIVTHTHTHTHTVTHSSTLTIIDSHPIIKVDNYNVLLELNVCKLARNVSGSLPHHFMT